jgi:hypothetical protein
MNRRILAFAMLAAAATACSGAAKTDLFGPQVQSGSSGTGSSSSSSSSGASSGSTSSSSGGVACERPQDCGKNQYCFFAACGTAGACRDVPAESDVKNPVCGCDGVSYWNESIAAASSVSVRSSGPCAGAGAKTCALGQQEVACQGDARCAAVATICTPTVSGVCWRIPSKCPKTDEIGRSCKDGKCDTVCNLMEAHVAFTSGVGCPR